MSNVFMQDCADAVRRADFGCIFKAVVDKTASYTIPDLGLNRSSTCYTNRGATGSITLTLPALTSSASLDDGNVASKAKGRYFYIEVAVAQNIVLTATGSKKINNGNANGSLTLSSASPGIIKLTFDGTGWYTSDVATTTAAAWGSVTGTLSEQTDLQAALDLKTDATTVQTATVSVTNAQIKGLRAAPKTLVAAPAAGKVLQFLGAALFLDYGTNALTESTANLAIKYTNGSGAAASETIESTGFIDATADTVINAIPVKDVIMVPAAALVLHNIGSGEIAGNAGADTVMKVYISYKVITL